MNRLVKEGHLGSSTKIEMSTCENCLAEKITHKPFGKAKRDKFPIQLIHPKIFGPMNLRERYDSTYLITFIDDFTHFRYVYLISHNLKHLSALKHI